MNTRFVAIPEDELRDILNKIERVVLLTSDEPQKYANEAFNQLNKWYAAAQAVRAGLLRTVVDDHGGILASTGEKENASDGNES